MVEIEKPKTFRDVEGIISEKTDEGIHTILRTKSGLVNLKGIEVIGVRNAEVWKNWWVKPQTLAIQFGEPAVCRVGTSGKSGRKALVCGKSFEEYLIE